MYCHNQIHCFVAQIVWAFTALCYSSLSIAANDWEVSHIHRKQLSSVLQHPVGTVRRNLNALLHHQRIECGIQHMSYAGDLRAWPLPRVPVSFMCVQMSHWDRLSLCCLLWGRSWAEENIGSERDCDHPRLSSWALHAEERWRSTASGSDSCGSGQAVKSPQQETKLAVLLSAVTPQLCYCYGFIPFLFIITEILL